MAVGPSRVAVEILARTGMHVGELCGLEADAVTLSATPLDAKCPLAGCTTTATSRCTPTSSSLSSSTGEPSDHTTMATCCQASRAS